MSQGDSISLKSAEELAESIDTSKINTQRRYFLIGATAAVGALGVVGAAVPFVKSWNPSAKARALGAPVTVDFSKLKPGEMMGPLPAWRGQPIFLLSTAPKTPSAVCRRTCSDSPIRNSTNVDQQPKYAQNPYRARRPELGLYVGICTHLGCVPKYYPVVQPEPFDADWDGGFFCPCHGSMYDLAGRVYKGVPAPDNLVVPPYQFLSDNVVEIGQDEETA